METVLSWVRSVSGFQVARIVRNMSGAVDNKLSKVSIGAGAGDAQSKVSLASGEESGEEEHGGKIKPDFVVRDPSKSIFDDISEVSSGEGSEDSAGSELMKTRITSEQLEEIALKLGLIKLCWPSRLDKEGEEADGKEEEEESLAPASYCLCDEKEKLILFHTENFRQQFHHVYKERKVLLLAVNNECNVQKMVCTTIKPTSLCYPELHEWKGCASFVADHITYRPLQVPTQLPCQLVSPKRVLKKQEGHSFEMATLLVSLLVGGGFDAYVVSGYATREVTNNDQLRVTCPDLVVKEEEKELTPPATPPKYQIRPPPDLNSNFFRKMEERERQKERDKIKADAEEERLRLQELERPPPDELWGFRRHGWVLLRPGPADSTVEDPVFIEPATGRYCSIDDPDYHHVDSVWNHLNYWVNIQPKNTNDTCEGTEMDLDNVKHWEHILVGEPIFWRKNPEDRGDVEEENVFDPVKAEKHLDIITSWVEPIELDFNVYEQRYPNGSKEILYKKAKVEMHAPYLQRDGLVKRITEYSDYGFADPIREIEIYKHRVDCWLECRRDLKENTAVDFYRRGRADALKEHHYVIGDQTLDSPRKLLFYDIARGDSLEYIELSPGRLEEKFSKRSDNLSCRSVEFVYRTKTKSDLVQTKRSATKIVECFERKQNNDADQDIQKRIFNLAEHKILLAYHYQPNSITASTIAMTKPARHESGENLVFNPNLFTVYQASGKQISQLDLFYLMQTQLQEESKSVRHLNEIEEEIANILRMRIVEVNAPQLHVSMFDEERNDRARQGLEERELRLQEEEAREIEADVDYLAPFIARVVGPNTTLTHAQALTVREECLAEFKRRYVQRAQNMQNRLDKLKLELMSLHKWFETENEKLTIKEEEKYRNDVSNLMLLIRTLTLLLVRHRDLARPRYNSLDNALRADKRLAVLYE